METFEEKAEEGHYELNEIQQLMQVLVIVLNALGMNLKLDN